MNKYTGTSTPISELIGAVIGFILILMFCIWIVGLSVDNICAVEGQKTAIVNGTEIPCD